MKYLFTPILFALTLAACGFQPLHGTYSTSNGAISSRALLNAVAIADIPDQTGVMLKNDLIDRFYNGPAPQNPLYTLNITKLTESMSDLDITVDDEATRRQLRLSTTYTISAADPAFKPVTRNVYSIVSFNVLESRFTTRVAEDNARKSAVADLARQIEQGVMLHLTLPHDASP